MTTATRHFIPIAPSQERILEPGEMNDWITLGGAIAAAIVWFWRHSLGVFFKWIWNGVKAPQRIAELKMENADIRANLEALRHDLHTAIGLARATWDTLSCAVWQSDSLGMCIHVNVMYREMLGFQLSELAGDQWKQAIHPDDKLAVYAEWSSAVKEHRPFNMRYRWQTKDGKIIPVHAQASVLLDSHGQVSGWVGFVTDLRLLDLEETPQTSPRRRHA
jgi:PAS domain S-box-containing protein